MARSEPSAVTRLSERREELGQRHAKAADNLDQCADVNVSFAALDVSGSNRYTKLPADMHHLAEITAIAAETTKTIPTTIGTKEENLAKLPSPNLVATRSRERDHEVRAVCLDGLA